MPSGAPRQNSIVAAAICCALLAVFGVISRTAIDEKSATNDEPLHLVGAWVQTHYFDFRCNPEDPPLWKYYVAVGTDPNSLKIDRQSPGWTAVLSDLGNVVPFVTQTMYRTSGNNPETVVSAARSRMIVLGVILGGLIAWWSWRLGGALAAVIATAAFSFDPNFLAHASLVKNDVAMTLLFVSLMMAVWFLGERATLWRWMTVALLLGAALTTKYSGILAIPMLGLALLCRAMMPSPWPISKCTARTRPQRLAFAIAVGASSLLVAYLFIWACYGFRFDITADPGQQLDISGILKTNAIFGSALDHNATPNTTHEQMLQWIGQWQPDAVVRSTRWLLDHHLLPQGWLAGFLYTYGTSRSRSTFLYGNINLVGWWYYFPAAILFKTPLATLIALATAVVLALRWNIASVACRKFWPLCVLVVPAVFYMAVAMTSHMNLGLRHVFPVYPFLFIFLGVVVAAAWRRRPKATAVTTVILAMLLVCETLFAYPDYIPFFNVAASHLPGGKLQLLSDSNIDWGQDLPLVAKWQKQHPDRVVYLIFSGSADPGYYGIKHYRGQPGASAPRPEEMKGKHYVLAISAIELQETNTADLDRSFYAPFRQSQPLDVLGGSIYLYDLN